MRASALLLTRVMPWHATISPNFPIPAVAFAQEDADVAEDEYDEADEALPPHPLTDLAEASEDVETAHAFIGNDGSRTCSARLAAVCGCLCGVFLGLSGAI